MTLRQGLVELMGRHGSLPKVAEHYGVTHAYLYRLYYGDRKNVSQKFLDKLGIKVEYDLNG